MTDLGPLPPCPVGKEGRHRLVFFVPEDAASDITASCQWCGTFRRVPAGGELHAGSLDDMSVDEIERRIMGLA